jgi:pilus assembly protein CpaF
MSLSDRLNRTEHTTESTPYLATGALRTIANVMPERLDIGEIRVQVNDELKELVGKSLYSGNLDPDTLQSMVYKAIALVIERSDYPLTDSDRAELVQEIVDDILGNGPLEQLLRDTEVTEIMVARFDTIYVERYGKLTATGLSFNNEDHLRKTIDRIVGKVGRRIDESSPLVDARLKDGSRVNAVVPPIALDGSTLTIRKFFKDPFTAKDMVNTGTLTTHAMEFLDAAVRGRMNIVISGGTGSGKTTTLNVVSSFIPDDERIVTIEDSAELQLAKPHVIRMETRPLNIEGTGLVTIRDLVRNSLRMRPDRIVVGEVRDGAALDMLQAMNTGHDGSLTTVHANSTTDAISRLETMSLMAGMELPMAAIRDQVGRAVNLIIQQTRMHDGSRRITAITELLGMHDGQIKTQDIFHFVYNKDKDSVDLGRLVATGHVPSFMDRLNQRGIFLDKEVFKK